MKRNNTSWIMLLVGILVCLPLVACKANVLPDETVTSTEEEMDAGAVSDTEYDDASKNEIETNDAIDTEIMTETNDAIDTEIMTETDAESNTEGETVAVGWHPDTGKFNEGKVEYAVDTDGSVFAAPCDGYTLGLDISDKTDLVGILYSIWFDFILGSGDDPVTSWYNVTEVLAGEQSWGPASAFHYWAKPAQGYYRSSDTEAVRNNMSLLYAAGVDFIILDHTNLHNGYLNDLSTRKRMIDDPMVALLNTIMTMRAAGEGTPYVVVWCGDNDGAMYRYMYDTYYNAEQWQDCFVYWDGLPLLLTTHTREENFPLKDEGLFTVRSMWGLGVDYGGGQWSYLNPNINGCVTYGDDGTPEHIGVSTAAQIAYMAQGTEDSMTSTQAVGRRQGITWYIQWYYAFQMHPKIVTLTWWNEWCAQRINLGGGQYAFVDNYNMEYSRDIEPMEGGHGDQYYQWLIQYISAYKGHLECPVLVEEGLEDSAIKLRKKAFR